MLHETYAYFLTPTEILTFKSDHILFASSPEVTNNFCHTEPFSISLIQGIPGVADSVRSLSDNHLPLVQSAHSLQLEGQRPCLLLSLWDKMNTIELLPEGPELTHGLTALQLPLDWAT